MPKTLEEVEKQLEEQGTKIKEAHDLLANAKFLSPDVVTEMQTKISEMQKRFDEIHAELHKKSEEPAKHRCFWCP